MARTQATITLFEPWVYDYDVNGKFINGAYQYTWNYKDNMIGLLPEPTSANGPVVFYPRIGSPKIGFSYTIPSDLYPNSPIYFNFTAVVSAKYLEGFSGGRLSPYSVVLNEYDGSTLVSSAIVATHHIDPLTVGQRHTIAYVPMTYAQLTSGHTFTITFDINFNFRSRFDIEGATVTVSLDYGKLLSESCNAGNTAFGYYDKLGTVHTYKQIVETVAIEKNSVACGYKPVGTKISEACALPTDKARIYSKIGIYSTGEFDNSTGVFTHYEAVSERNVVECGYKPRGTLLSESCSVAGDQFRPHEKLGHYSTGIYDADGVFSTYPEVIDPRSVDCGYVPTGSITFTANVPNTVFNVAGKGIFRGNQTVNNWTLGTYTFTASAVGYSTQSGSFTVTPSGVVVSAIFPEVQTAGTVTFEGTPRLARVYREGVYLGLADPDRAYVVPAGQAAYTIQAEGYQGASVTVQSQATGNTKQGYNLTPVQKPDTTEVYFEAYLTDPVTYQVLDRVSLRDAFGFTYTENYINFSNFSFSLPSTVREFEDLIATPNGQAGIVLYVNGQVKVQGLIQNYSPTGDGFITVTCAEILAGLDDAWNGKLDLTNVEFEYQPSEVGIDANIDRETQYEYWNYGFGKHPFFYSDGITENSRIGESADGISVGEGNTAVVKVRAFKARKYPTYVLHMKGLGKPFTKFNLNYEGGFSITFDGLKFVLMNGAGTVATTENVERYIIGGGQQDIYESLANADVYYTFRYSEISPTETKISAEVKILYLGVFKTYTIPETTIAVASQPASVEPSVTLSNGAGIARMYVESREMTTFIDWLNTVGEGQEGYNSVKVRFVQGAGNRAAGHALRLSFDDPNRWQAVSSIIELIGNCTLEYVGVLEGKPTFLVHDFTELPTVRKFYDLGQIFNANYQKDLANVFNVLTIRATDSTQGLTTSVNNTFSITISPTPERPNTLGRLRPMIMGAEGIRDIDTLIQYAFSVYDEHNKATEPIDFETITDTFWLGCVTGQFVTIYGLPEGRIITEQINSMTFNQQQGTIRIELAERLTLVAALMQARLKANSY